MGKIEAIRKKIHDLPKSTALAIITLIYFLAFGIAWILILLLPSDNMHPLVLTLFADIGATVFVFLVSQLLQNASTYDPYWSVAPIPVLLFYWHFNPAYPQLNLRQIIVIALVALWAIRLTANWIYTWYGFQHEDWRYVNYRQGNPETFWLVNFFGIQLFPTIIVFLGCLSLWPIFATPAGDAPLSFSDLQIGDYFGLLVALVAIAFELIADIQMHQFASNPENKGTTIQSGLWKISRHPNYFGEISFWWGLYFFALAANPNWWWVIIGPVMMVALFLGISIPMMEKRNIERRMDYPSYQNSTSKLFPLPPSLIAKLKTSKYPSPKEQTDSN